MKKAIVPKNIALIFIILVVIVIGMVGAIKSHATQSYPANLNISGYGNYHSQLIEPAGSTFTVKFDWQDTMPANLSASVLIENQDHTVKDAKVVGPTRGGGSFTLTEENTGPVYIDIVGGHWSVSVN